MLELKKAAALKLKVNELFSQWDMGVFLLCSPKRMQNNFARWTKFIVDRIADCIMCCKQYQAVHFNRANSSKHSCIMNTLLGFFGICWAWNLWVSQHGNRKTYTNTSGSRFGWAQVLDSRNAKTARRRTWDWWQTVWLSPHGVHFQRQVARLNSYSVPACSRLW
jgi:hypothetical protein